MRDVTKDEVEADCAAEAVLLVSRLLLRYLRTIDVIHDSVGLTTLSPTFHKLSWRFLEMEEWQSMTAQPRWYKWILYIIWSFPQTESPYKFDSPIQ